MSKDANLDRRRFLGTPATAASASATALVPRHVLGGAGHVPPSEKMRGRPLKWDPVKEEFVGDAEANRCLDRARREPWAI